MIVYCLADRRWGNQGQSIVYRGEFNDQRSDDDDIVMPLLQGNSANTFQADQQQARCCGYSKRRLAGITVKDRRAWDEPKGVDPTAKPEESTVTWRNGRTARRSSPRGLIGENLDLVEWRHGGNSTAAGGSEGPGGQQGFFYYSRRRDKENHGQLVEEEGEK